MYCTPGKYKNINNIILLNKIVYVSIGDLLSRSWERNEQAKYYLL